MNNSLIQDKYQILEQLGIGGMGVVYRAMHTVLNRVDALKVLHPQYSADKEFLDRFVREARAMARLDHPNIIRIYDVFTDGKTNYIAMEYFQGESLIEYLKRRPVIPVAEAVYLVTQIAQALAYAHEQGIVHRDIKPANILIKSGDIVKIADFGIAAVADELTLTSTGQMVGSPRYMSPEQARGQVTDYRSDLFSLGMVFYQMISGTTPFEGDSSVAIIGKLAYEKEELQLIFPPKFPKQVTTIIQQLLRRDATQRMPSAHALLNALNALDESITSHPNLDATLVKYRRPHAFKPHAERSRRTIMMASVSVIVLLAGATALYFSGVTDRASHMLSALVSDAATQDTQPAAESKSEKDSANTEQLPQDAIPADSATLKLMLEEKTAQLRKSTGNVAKAAQLARTADAQTYAKAEHQQALDLQQQLEKTNANIASHVKEGKLYIAVSTADSALDLAQSAQAAFERANKSAVSNKLLAQAERQKHSVMALLERAISQKKSISAETLDRESLNTYKQAEQQESEARGQLQDVDGHIESGRLQIALQSIDIARQQLNTVVSEYSKILAQPKSVAKTTAEKSLPTRDPERELADAHLLLAEFLNAYNKRDFKKLNMISEMSSRRQNATRKIFERYQKIDAELTDFSMNKSTVTATLVINQLVDNNGAIAMPADSWKFNPLQLEKHVNGWGKVKW